MTINHDKEVKVPAWIFSVIVPILITIFGYSIAVTKANAMTSAQVEQMQSRIDYLEKTKASTERVEDLIGTLIRIEMKLDNYIQHDTGK